MLALAEEEKTELYEVSLALGALELKLLERLMDEGYISYDDDNQTILQKMTGVLFAGMMELMPKALDELLESYDEEEV